MSPLIVHHLRYSQSERVTWLCQELGLDYELKCYDRAPLLSPEEYCKLHPLCAAPVVNDGDITMAESAACVEYIAQKFGNGKLIIKPGDRNWTDYLYWFHFANGTLQPSVSRKATQPKNLDTANPVVKRMADKFNDILAHMDEHLKTSAYLAGDELSAADIMSVFSLTTMRCFSPIDLTGYDGILAYLKRVSEREAYQQALKRSDPQLVAEELVSAKGPPLHPVIAKVLAGQSK